MTTDVIVIGGGPSGLTAALRMKQAGKKVRILEASDRVGGKMRTTPRDGFLVDQGAFFLPTTHRTMLSIAAETGFADQIVPGGFVLAIARDGLIHNLDGDHLAGSIVKTRALSTRAKLELVKLAPELLRSRRASYARIPECAAYDTETVAQWAKKHLSAELGEYLIDTTLRGIFASSADAASRVDFLGIMALFKGAKLAAFRGGMGSYAAHIARDQDVVLGAEALSVEAKADHVTVTWRDPGGTEHSEDSAACVVAVPSAVANRILPGLDHWRREFMGRVRDGKLFVLNIALSRPPAGVDATYIQVPRATHPFLTGILLDHHKAPGRAPAGKGLLSVAVLDSWSEQHWHDDDSDVRDRMLEALDCVLPGTSQHIEFTELHRWQEEYNRVGFYRDLGRFRQICEQDSRIQLAGDFHSMQNMESATRTGQRAAQRLVKGGFLA